MIWRIKHELLTRFADSFIYVLIAHTYCYQIWLSFLNQKAQVRIKMGRIKLDDRIRTLIENGIANKHRSMFVIIGEKARDQVVTLHHILSKATISQRPSVLWCYKKNLGFSSHRQKRIKEIKKRKAAGLTSSKVRFLLNLYQELFFLKEEDIFEQFIASTKIQYCYYAESHRILGNTFGLILLIF